MKIEYLNLYSKKGINKKKHHVNNAQLEVLNLFNHVQINYSL